MERSFRAAHTNELFLVYQPQYSVETGQVVGVEALVRWNHPDLGLVVPAEFIPIAEEIGIINQLSIWILEEACSQNKKWQELGHPHVRVSVNLSPSHLVDTMLANDIFDALENTGLHPMYLELEITENIFIDATRTVYTNLEILKASGVRIAIDDFGTGYSCLSYLRDFPVGTIKIDGSFIKRLGDGKGNDGIVASTITLGHSLELQIVAEGVETKKQADHLQRLNCDINQGYYYSRPLDASYIEALLAEQNCELRKIELN